MLRALCLSLLLMLVTGARAQGVDMLVFINPGLFEQARDGRITGIGGELIQRLGAVSGVPIRIRVLPPARVIQTLTQQPGACVAGVPRLAETESQLRWLGLLSNSALMLYGRPDESRHVRSAADLRGTVVVVQRNSLPANWLREQGVAAQEVRDTPTALRMLLAGRVDYWLVNELVAQRVFQSQGGAVPARPLQSFGQITTYLACHRDTAPAALDRLRAAVERLHRDGELVPFGVRP